MLRSGLTTLKVLRNVRLGVVQLSDMLEDMKDMGKRSNLQLSAVNCS